MFIFLEIDFFISQQWRQQENAAPMPINRKEQAHELGKRVLKLGIQLSILLITQQPSKDQPTIKKKVRFDNSIGSF